LIYGEKEMWDELPLEVKLRILSLLDVAGESRHDQDLFREDEEEDLLGTCPRRNTRRHYLEEVSHEWHDLLWQERSHLDLSLRAALKGATTAIKY
jgi:hypothetical protein